MSVGVQYILPPHPEFLIGSSFLSISFSVWEPIDVDTVVVDLLKDLQGTRYKSVHIYKAVVLYNT